jgi:hypothetical protein
MRAHLGDYENAHAELMLSQTNTLHLQNEMLRAARDLLLPRLMSGEIPVEMEVHSAHYFL